jgi:hypothetical protein
MHMISNNKINIYVLQMPSALLDNACHEHYPDELIEAFRCYPNP